MSKSYFITGTNTGVGKSVATALLAKFFKISGFSVAVYKPIESGCEGSKSLDMAFIKDIADVDTFNSYCLSQPLSPHLSAKIDGVNIDIEAIKEKFQKLKKSYDIVLIEGAGGVCVPINYSGYMMANLIKDLKIEAIVVATTTLGTINHSILTYEYLKNIGMRVRGFIFNYIEKMDLNIAKDSIDIICKITGAKSLGHIEFGAKEFEFNKGLLDG